MTRILAAQINPTFGDFKANSAAILGAIAEAKSKQCSLILTPELALVGYPPNDLLLSKDLIRVHNEFLLALAKETKNITLILGALRVNEESGKPLFNTAYHIENGRIIGYYDKCLLPTYDVFDEQRYFEEGQSSYCFIHKNQKIALSICEDIWSHQMFPLYSTHPIERLDQERPDLLLNLSASPFEIHKWPARIKLAQDISRRLNCLLLYCNQVGGNDDLVFDGHSFLTNETTLLGKATGFKEESYVFDTDIQTAHPFNYGPCYELYQALALGIQDYFHKQNFSKAVLGLSGGIDSALVACLLKEALGSKNVTALLMPSRYSSSESITDAIELSKNLGLTYHIIDIENLHTAALKTLHPFFKNTQEGLAEENIQARVRGLLLMAYSNKLGHLVIGCSNKSEMAVGYATLYGDMIGALCPIADLTKSQVYELAYFLQQKYTFFPKNILIKAPSAELRPNQRDSDTLPPYDFLDAVLEGYIEKGLTPEQIAKRAQKPLEEVQALISKFQRSEYKRRQSPLLFKVTPKAFSSGWKFPIVQHWTP